MFKNKSPFSHGHPHTQTNTNQQPHNPSRSPVAHITTQNNPGINVNGLFAQNFGNNAQNFNGNGNKGRYNGVPNNLGSNNVVINNNTNGGMFKKNNPINFDLNLQCDEILKNDKLNTAVAELDFMCNQQLIPLTRNPSNTSANTPKHLDKAQTQRFQPKRQQRKQSHIVINGNYNNSKLGGAQINSARHAGQALIDLQCNQQLFYKQKQKQNNIGNKLELDEIKRRVETILECYQRVITQKNDTIMKLQAQNQMLKMKNFGK